jgi:transcriptional regulator NrdR family protein
MKTEQHGSFLCPSCGTGKGQVKDSRPTEAGIRRRRVCMSCRHRWTTMEMTAQRNLSRRLLADLKTAMVAAEASIHAVNNLLIAMETSEDD